MTKSGLDKWQILTLQASQDADDADMLPLLWRVALLLNVSC